MKLLSKILTIILMVNFNLFTVFAQEFNLQNFLDTSIQIIEEQHDNLPIFYEGELEVIFINTNGLIDKQLDTVINCKTLIKFSLYPEEIFFMGKDFWFETINYEEHENQITYKFCINSFYNIDTLNYVIGTYYFQERAGKWHFSDKDIEKSSFSDLKEIFSSRDQRDYVEDYSYILERPCWEPNFNLQHLNERVFTTANDTLIGNWQTTISTSNFGSDYTEFLFLNDTIYSLSALIGFTSPIPYEIQNNKIKTTHYGGETFFSRFRIIDLNTFEIFDDNLNDNGLNEGSYTLHRISDGSFVLSDIKHWKEPIIDNGCECMKEAGKFYDAFHERRIKFEEK